MKEIKVVSDNGWLKIQSEGADTWVFVPAHDDEYGVECLSEVGTAWDTDMEGTIAHCARCNARLMAENFGDIGNTYEQCTKLLAEFLFWVPPPPPKTREELEDERACAAEYNDYLNSDR